MRLVFFGSGDFAVPSLRWLINKHSQGEHPLLLVVTQPDRPAGRGKQPMPTPVAAMAIEHGIPVERVEDVNAEPFIARIKNLKPDLGVVIAFGQKLKAPLRGIFPSECINLHASLLPQYRGAAPIPAAILAGETRTGVTIFRLVDRMDAGPILVQRETSISLTETSDDLKERLSRVGCDAMDGALRLYGENALPPGVPQDESKATKAPKLSKADGYLRFDVPAEEIARRARAMWPWPGGRCRYVNADRRSEEITICNVMVVPNSPNVSPGVVTDVFTIATAAGALEIGSLQPAGKRLMSWQDFVNGRRVKAGERLVGMVEGESGRVGEGAI